MAKTKIRVTRAYYTWHPDFVDHGDGTYDVGRTGRWIVEWDLKIANNNWVGQHHTAECSTEKLAERLISQLMRWHYKGLPYGEVESNDLVFKNGRFCLFGGHYTIVPISAPEQAKASQP